MQYLFLALFGLVILGLLAWLAWISIQSLFQARLLFAALGLTDLKDRLDRAVAVWGRTEPLDPLGRKWGEPAIWAKEVDQHYKHGGKNSGWRTDATREDSWPFALHFPGGGRVLVRGKPTEVHGEEGRTVSRGTDLRTVHSWLPAGGDLTVLGKVVLADDGATLVPHGKAGFLFSTKEPRRQAAWELVKGIAGALFVLFALLILLLLAVSADLG
jgi:hypothetical protein